MKMSYIKIPSEIITRRIREYHKNIQKDFAEFPNPPEMNVPEGQLLSNRKFPSTLAYIKTREQNEDGVMFDLMARNREPENIEKAAEDVVKIIESQEFTVAEALMFLNHIEGMVLASPVSY